VGELPLWGGRRWTWGPDESAPHIHGGEGDRGYLRFPRGEVGLWVVTTRLGFEGVVAAVLTLAAAFFLDFPAAHLGTAVDLSSGF